MSKITEQELAEIIAELMIESPDSENPNPQHNAYNWGLAHAEMAFRGVPVEAIKKLQ